MMFRTFRNLALVPLAFAALGACATPVDEADVAVERTTTTEAPATTTEAPATTTTTVAPAPTPTTTTAPPAPAEPIEVTNARRSAESYIDMMPFSRSGLIDQLEFEGYGTDSATAAVDSLAIDYHAQAIRSAESYVEMMPFSHSGLVDQLEFEGYSTDEATHGANAVLGGA